VTSRPTAQAARNEVVFRELNEALGASSNGQPEEVSGFVCECSDISCTAVIGVPLGEYERIRREPTWFVIAPDESHVDRTVERVVERAAGYWVVEKLGDAGEIAAATAPA